MGSTQPHHRGAFGHAGKQLRRQWTANPFTRCWRCGKRLHECRPHRNGRPARWTVGHLPEWANPHTTIDAVLIDGRWCAPECSPENYSHGALDGNARRRGTTLRGGRYVRPTEPHSEQW